MPVRSSRFPEFLARRPHRERQLMHISRPDSNLHFVGQPFNQTAVFA